MSPILYLLDTNTVSYFLRAAYVQLDERLDKARTSEVGVAAVTEAELLYGLAKNPSKMRKELVEDFLRHANVLAFDSRTARVYAGLRSNLEKAGRPLAPFDLMIAANAIAADATLITSDRAFAMVPDLRCEDWTK